MNHARRASIAGILDRMSGRGRARLTTALQDFVQAADMISTNGAWTLGLTTEYPIAGTGGTAA
jgi:hypothetical protein